MTTKPTPLIKKAVPAIKKAGLLSKLTGEKDTVLLQMNPREAGPVIGLLQSMGGAAVKNPRTGILSFPPAGGQASHDHDAAGGMGGSSRGGGGGNPGGNGPGNGANANGTGSDSGGVGAGTTGPGGNGPGNGGNPNGIGADAGGIGAGTPTHSPAAAGDPTSPLGVLSLAVKNFFSTKTLSPQSLVGIGTMALPAPIGIVAKAALSYGMAAGQKNKEVLDGIHNGTITGPGVSTSTDANGTEVGHVGGAAYGGTAGPHGGDTGIGGGGGDPAYFNQQQQQNALNASTGIPGMIQQPPAGAPANVPSLGLLGQYSQPYQQWTTPGYGFQVPGQGYLQWGQK